MNMDRVSTVIEVLFQIFVLKHNKHVLIILQYLFGLGGGLLIYVYVCLTRYSNTSVSDFCVWMISWRVTMLACFRSFNKDTEDKGSNNSNIFIINNIKNNKVLL